MSTSPRIEWDFPSRAVRTPRTPAGFVQADPPVRLHFVDGIGYTDAEFDTITYRAFDGSIQIDERLIAVVVANRKVG